MYCLGWKNQLYSVVAMASLLRHGSMWERGLVLTGGALAAASLLTIIYGTRRIQPRAYKAPSATSVKPGERHPYPYDALPGGREVTTPYGTLRAYEWGPPEGQRVLFVHGISTPCISLAAMADQMARQGCRVLVFDLFGRGYSDAPDPAFVRHDGGLFSLQILAVLASSEGVNWMGGFTLVGFSLGGGISADFTYHFPHLVDSLVLIAPSGLMRRSRIAFSSRVLYGGYLPEWLVNYWVSMRIKGGGMVPSLNLRGFKKWTLAVTDVAHEEVPGDGVADHVEESTPSLFDGRPAFDMNESVTWQVDSHPGFVPSFVSCIQHAPIHYGHDKWRVIGERCAERRAGVNQAAQARGLREGKVLIILGQEDTVTWADQTIEDAKATLGERQVSFKLLPAGHDVPFAQSEACMRAVVEHWKDAAPAA